MQLSYALETINDQSDKKDPIKSLKNLLDNSRELCTFMLYYITEVARYAEKDASHRASKNLTSAHDLNVNIKIAGNEVMWKIIENKSFISAIEQYKPNLLEEGQNMIKKTYQALIQMEEYRTYIAENGRTKKGESGILEFIMNDLLLTDEKVILFFEENFPTFDDDVEMLQKIVKGIFQKPNGFDLQGFLPEETWQYAKSIFRTIRDKKEYLLDLIKPKLRNWDSERIAHIDMILLEMGVAELLYFETIPPKVTINEYIDIAKEYSTDQSGQFINGILDGLKKDFEAEGRLNKIDFRK
ncbi:transcription antitermination factor NusB [Rhizosphaericola mali]|nr:transcription antitermination factor NusB [Rhizosphaericola mali]